MITEVGKGRGKGNIKNQKGKGRSWAFFKGCGFFLRITVKFLVFDINMRGLRRVPYMVVWSARKEVNGPKWW